MKQNRFRSKALWAAVLSQVVVILLATHMITTDTVNLIEIITGAVFEILTLFGIFNDPTTKGQF